MSVVSGQATVRCTKANPCKHCQRGDERCWTAPPGPSSGCYRTNSGDGIQKQDSAGATYWLYDPTPAAERNGHAGHAKAKASPKRAPLGVRAAVYGAVLAIRNFKLADAHRAGLVRRGLADREIDRLGYRSMPPANYLRSEMASFVAKACGRDKVLATPGFYVRESGELSIAGGEGLIVPVRTVKAQTAALYIRSDNPGDDGPKYYLLSSAKRGGPSAESTTHVPLGIAGPLEVVRLTEGALKADVATSLSGLPTVGVPGVGNWKSAIAALKALGAKTVRLAYDADWKVKKEVARALVDCYRALIAAGFIVAIETWDEADGKGIDDVLAAGKSPDVLEGDDARAIMDRVSAIAGMPPETNGRPEPDWEKMGQEGAAAMARGQVLERPQVLLTTYEKDVADQVIGCLEMAPDLYRRGDQLVMPRREDETPKGILRPTGSPRIGLLPPAALREQITATCFLYKMAKGKDGEEFERSVNPPQWLAPAIIARGSWPALRPLEAIVETPVMRPDGTLLDAAGYDPDTGIIYEPTVDLPAIPQLPTRIDARKAADLLLDLLCDFPVVGEAHKAVWLAGLLSPLARFAFYGCCPLTMFDASTAGSGKTLLAALISWILTGRDVARTTYSDVDEEMRKRITAIAIGADRLMLLDNIAGDFGGSAIDAALTAPVWQDRLLGENRMITLPLLTTWYGSGNNVQFRGDAIRRVLLCRLEPKEENPETRSGFKYQNIQKYVVDNRGRLVAAALTILRAYAVAGRPSQGVTPLGSFEEWSRLVRNAVIWATDLDPCSTQEELRAADPESAGRVALIEGWAELPGAKSGAGVTVSEALRFLKHEASQSSKDSNYAEKFTQLKDVLSGWGRGSDLPSAISIGKKLQKMRGRVINGKVFKSTPFNNTLSWAVAPAGGTGDTGDTGDTSKSARNQRNPESEQSKNHREHETPPVSPVSPCPDEFEEGEL